PAYLAPAHASVQARNGIDVAPGIPPKASCSSAQSALLMHSALHWTMLAHAGGGSRMPPPAAMPHSTRGLIAAWHGSRCTGAKNPKHPPIAMEAASATAPAKPMVAIL